MQAARTTGPLLLVLLLLAAVYAIRIGPPTTEPVFGPDAQYFLVGAKSIAEGQGYRLINDPDKPGILFFPAGYPALLAPWLAFVVSIDPVGVTVLRAVTALSLLIALVLGHGILRRYVSARVALLSVAFVGLHPFVVYWAGELISDNAFMMWSAAALLILVRREAGDERGRWPWEAQLAVAGLCAGLAALTRHLGVALIGAAVLTFVLHRRWRDAAVFVVSAGLVLGPWLAMSADASRGSLAVADSIRLTVFSLDFGQAGDHLWRLVTREAPAVVFPGSNVIRPALAQWNLAWLFPVLSLPVTAVALVGLITLMKRRQVIGWYVSFYVLLIVLYPIVVSRYYIPAYILLPVLLATGVTALAARWNQFAFVPRLRMAPVAALLALSVLGLTIVNLVTIGNVWRYGHSGGMQSAKRWDGYAAAFDWLKHNVPQDGVIITLYAPAAYLLTDRSAISTFPQEKLLMRGVMQTLLSDRYTDALDGIEATLSHVRGGVPTFVLGAEHDLDNLNRFVEAQPGRARFRWQTADRDIVIYEITQPSSVRVF